MWSIAHSKQFGTGKNSNSDETVDFRFITVAVLGCNASLHALAHCAYHLIDVAVIVYCDTNVWLIAILYSAEAKNLSREK